MALKRKINAFELNTHTCWENERDFKNSFILNFGCSWKRKNRTCVLHFQTWKGNTWTYIIIGESYNPDSIQTVA